MMGLQVMGKSDVGGGVKKGVGDFEIWVIGLFICYCICCGGEAK